MTDHHSTSPPRCHRRAKELHEHAAGADDKLAEAAGALAAVEIICRHVAEQGADLTAREGLTFAVGAAREALEAGRVRLDEVLVGTRLALEAHGLNRAVADESAGPANRHTPH